MEYKNNGESIPAMGRMSRRAFAVTAAGACGVAALWSFHRLALDVVKADASNAYGGDAGTESSAPGMVTIVQFSADGKRMGKVSVPRVIKSDAEWKKQLVPISYEVTRHAGTEPSYSGSTWDLHDKGIFRCVCCDVALFSSETKFESGTGWPSFWQPIAPENVVETRDDKWGMDRTAVSCRQCDAHLGHVFDDGPNPTGLRYCMNSAAMRFVKAPAPGAL